MRNVTANALTIAFAQMGISVRIARFRGSSEVERLAVNELVVGSIPTRGADRSGTNDPFPSQTMRKEQYDAIAHLEKIEFVKALLEVEKERFQPEQFTKKSTFEDINADFGIFPTIPTYPVYFAGDITKQKTRLSSWASILASMPKAT